VRTWAALIAWLGLAVDARPESLRFGPFGEVKLYRPDSEARQVVLFVSGDGGWNRGVVPMAERLREQGALVAGIDIRSYLRGLERSAQSCIYPAGDLEELSRAVQLQARLPSYHPPILVGYSSGATLVYLALVAAPPESFAGALSLGFCPDLEVGKAPCSSHRIGFRKRAKGIGYDLEPARSLQRPWLALQGEADRVCPAAVTRAFVAQVPAGRLVSLPKVGHGFAVTRNWEAAYLEAYRSLAAPREAALPTPGAAIADLPLVEAATSAGPVREEMAVLISGDGGWAEIDKGLTAALNAQGLPVVGLNSLRYFWTPRTPEGGSADLERVLRHYLAAWRRSRAVLIGYSFGADVLPFLAARLPAELRSHLAGIALIGLSETASFEFHVAGWLGGGGDPRYRTRPEIARLAGMRVLCIRGSAEADSACVPSRAEGYSVVTLPGGHHFEGDYGRLGREILGRLELAPRTGATATPPAGDAWLLTARPARGCRSGSRRP
jgi:type IV secretory pathway VirJ component